MIDPSEYKLYYLSGDIGTSFFEVNGINNLNFQKNLSYDSRFSLGGVSTAYSVNAPEEINLSFERSFVNYDNLFDYTGSSPVREFKIYNGKTFFIIKNAYLRNYSASFSVGELPKIGTTFSSYGVDIEQIEYFDDKNIDPVALDIPKLNSISISGVYDQDLKNKYNIFSFDYELMINRQSYYSIGQSNPTEVSPILPLEIKVSISSKIPDDLRVLDIPVNNDSLKDFDIIVSGSSSLFKLPIRNAKLISSNASMTSSNSMELRKEFIGYYGLQ